MFEMFSSSLDRRTSICTSLTAVSFRTYQGHFLIELHQVFIRFIKLYKHTPTTSIPLKEQYPGGLCLGFEQAMCVTHLDPSSDLRVLLLTNPWATKLKCPEQTEMCWCAIVLKPHCNSCVSWYILQKLKFSFKKLRYILSVRLAAKNTRPINQSPTILTQTLNENLSWKRLF